MGVPRYPVTPEPFCKQGKAETKTTKHLLTFFSKSAKRVWAMKKQAPLILRIWPSSNQFPLLSPSSTEGCTFASLQFGEDKPFRCISSASEGVNSPGIPLKTIFLTPLCPVAPMLYLLWLFSLPDLLQHNTLHRYFHNLADPGLHPALTLTSGSQDKHYYLS